MKEGFEKDFFDSLHIYDDHVPLLLLLDPGKNYTSLPSILPYPSKHSFSPIEPSDVLTSVEI